MRRKPEKEGRMEKEKQKYYKQCRNCIINVDNEKEVSWTERFRKLLQDKNEALFV